MSTCINHNEMHLLHPGSLPHEQAFLLPEIYSKKNNQGLFIKIQRIFDFKLYKKYTENVHGIQLGHRNQIPNPICVTELICSLGPNVNGRYVIFRSANGNMINQLDEYQL